MPGIDVVLARVDVLVSEVTNLLGATGFIGEGLLVAIGSTSELGDESQAAALVGVVNVLAAGAGKRAFATRLHLATGVALGRVNNKTLLDSTLLFDDGSDGGSGNGGVVGDRSSLSLLDLGSKDGRGGNRLSSPNVDHLRSSGNKAADCGGSDGVTHLDGLGEIHRGLNEGR